MKTFNSVGEEIRYFTHKVEEVEDQQLEENIVRDLIESYLQESSLSKMIGDTPGGQSLVKYMHSKHLLSNDANYEEQPFNERVMWTTFKDNPDNFFILSGTHGVAGIKPNAADINRGIQRKENKILQLENFPAYFSNIKNFNSEIISWLQYK